MGCHIDGFVAVVGHTKVIANGPIVGRVADVLTAANTAANVAFKLVRPGNKAKDVVEAVKMVADTYGCKIVEGSLPPYKLEQYDIDSSADAEDDVKFEVCQVYAVNIVTSSGSGKAKCFDDMKTTVFRRAVDKNIHLKERASKLLFSEITQKFPRMPFTTRAIAGDYSSFDYQNCMMHGLLHPYHVFYENEGELVAQIKFTVLLMPNGSDKITTYGLQELVPTISIDADSKINTWLSLSTKTKRKGGGKRKKGKKDNFFEDLFSALQFEIVARLPLKSFASCRAINRHFHTMLSDRDLLQRLHLQQAQYPIFLCVGQVSNIVVTHVATLDLQNMEYDSFLGYMELGAAKDFQVHSSCNGFLVASYDNEAFFCNPLTRSYVRLPRLVKSCHMYGLYYCKDADQYRVFCKLDIHDIWTNYYLVYIGNEMHTITIRCGNFEPSDEPTPIMVGSLLYWLQEPRGNALEIMMFDTLSETLGHIEAPPLTEKIKYWSSLLDLNGELGLSIAWRSQLPSTLDDGPSHVDLWVYSNNIWVSKLSVALCLADVMPFAGRTLTGEGPRRWTAFFCSEGHIVVRLADGCLVMDLNGRLLKVVGDGHAYMVKPLGFTLRPGIFHLPALRFMAKEVKDQELNDPKFLRISQKRFLRDSSSPYSLV